MCPSQHPTPEQRVYFFSAEKGNEKPGAEQTLIISFPQSKKMLCVVFTVNSLCSIRFIIVHYDKKIYYVSLCNVSC